MANTTTTKVNRLGLTHRQTVMIVLLLVGTFVTVLNQTVVAPALPSIMVDMSINAATGQWLTTGFTLVNAIMVPVTAFLTIAFLSAISSCSRCRSSRSARFSLLGGRISRYCSLVVSFRQWARVFSCPWS